MQPTTTITSLQDVMATSAKIQAGEDVPLDVLQACLAFLRQERMSGAATAKAKAAGKASPKQPLDMKALMEEI